jgi:hypothetical protein
VRWAAGGKLENENGFKKEKFEISKAGESPRIFGKQEIQKFLRVRLPHRSSPFVHLPDRAVAVLLKAY